MDLEVPVCKICGKPTSNEIDYICDDCWEEKYIFNIEKQWNIDKVVIKCDKCGIYHSPMNNCICGKDNRMDKKEAFIETFKPGELRVNSNIGRKDDSDKLRYDLLDPEFVEGIVKILTFGAKKYEPQNWRKLKDNGGPDRCYAALQRHMAEYRKGNKIDPESGVSHLFHAACNLYFLEYFDRSK